MEKSEILQLIAAVLILTAIAGFKFALANEWQIILYILLFSVILISVVVLAKKAMANILDSDVEHSLWKVSRYGFKQSHYFENEIPAGIIFPILLSLFSIGSFIVPTLLTYETRALKRRAANRSGFYSFTEMTDWHNGLIGAAGIIAALILSIIMYLLGQSFEYLAIISTLYAFFNMIPISKLDGTQIFFGSRVLWTTLALISALFTIYAFLIVFVVI